MDSLLDGMLSVSRPYLDWSGHSGAMPPAPGRRTRPPVTLRGVLLQPWPLVLMLEGGLVELRARLVVGRVEVEECLAGGADDLLEVKAGAVLGVQVDERDQVPSGVDVPGDPPGVGPAADVVPARLELPA